MNHFDVENIERSIRVKPEYYDEFISDCVRMNLDFCIKKYGSTKSIIHKNKEYVVFKKDDKIKGSHVISEATKDINKVYKKKVGYFGEDFMYSFCNTEAFEGFESGRTMFGIDVKDCYWDTLYKLGYISGVTYFSGLKKKEWKQARNSAIGSLIAETTYIFCKGDKVIHTQTVNKKDEKLKGVRGLVLKHVWDMFYDIYQRYSQSCLMFLTDCMYVRGDFPPHEIIEIYKEYGYQGKVSVYELTECGFDSRSFYVRWHDYEAKSKFDSGIKEENGKKVIFDKHYVFASNQIINKK